MSSLSGFLLAALALSIPSIALVQEDPAPGVEEQEALVAKREADFAALLTGAKLVGFFTQNAEPDAEPQEDSYTITRVSKADGDNWLFEAGIEFGGRNIPFRLKLPVKWAGDTPVITVTDVSFPMLGSYTARVLFHGDQYIGLWSGKNDGGQMWGRVRRAEIEVETK